MSAAAIFVEELHHAALADTSPCPLIRVDLDAAPLAAARARNPGRFTAWTLPPAHFGTNAAAIVAASEGCLPLDSAEALLHALSEMCADLGVTLPHSWERQQLDGSMPFCVLWPENLLVAFGAALVVFGLVMMLRFGSLFAIFMTTPGVLIVVAAGIMEAAVYARCATANASAARLLSDVLAAPRYADPLHRRGLAAFVASDHNSIDINALSATTMSRWPRFARHGVIKSCELHLIIGPSRAVAELRRKFEDVALVLQQAQGESAPLLPPPR